MAFVRITSPEHHFYNCVFEVVCMQSGYYPQYNLKYIDGSDDTFSVDMSKCTPVSDEEAATIDLTDQICYKNASDYFEIGQHVIAHIGGEDIHARVVRFGHTNYYFGDAKCMVIVRFRPRWCTYSDTRIVRMDKLEIVKDDPEENKDELGRLPIGFDYLNFQPIYEDDDHYDLYEGENSNEDPIGIVLYDTIGDGWEICEDCGRAVCDFEQDESTSICRACYDNSYSRCDDCGSIVLSTELYEGDEGWYCESCIDEHRPASDFFHDYSYTPNTLYFRDMVDGQESSIPEYLDVPNKAYLGVELEIDDGDREECLRDLQNTYGEDDLFYCKYDGSLNGPGIEIVTHPCTLQYHMHAFPWEKITDIAKDNRYRSHDTTTCGMHVHVSRVALGDNTSERDLTVAKIMLLMDKFWKKLVVFSRREEEKLNRWAKKPNAGISRGDTANGAVRKAKKACDGGHMQRYHALNITNTNTIEFRLFRGTLNPETIMANLQLVANIVGISMARDLLGVQDATWEDVVKFQEYPELNAYLARKHLDNFADDPLGDVITDDKVAYETGDKVICTIDSENPFPAEITEVIQGDAYVVRNSAADCDYRMAFADEMQPA